MSQTVRIGEANKEGKLKKGKENEKRDRDMDEHEERERGKSERDEDERKRTICYKRPSGTSFWWPPFACETST